MTHRITAPLAAGLLALAALGGGAARAEPLGLHVRPRGEPLFMQHAIDHPWHLRGNPNVTPSNPMGVVGWDGPPADVPDVIGDAGPLPPGSPANVPFEGLGYGLY